VVERVVLKGSHFHRRAARGLLELRRSKSPTGLVLPTCGQRGCVRPSLPSPAGSSPRSGSDGCEREERSWQSPAGELLAPLPLSCLSVQLVLTAAPKSWVRPPRVPSPALAVTPAIPPLPLGLSGGREASPVSASAQSLCMAASARPSVLGVRVRGLVQKRPTFAGPRSPAV